MDINNILIDDIVNTNNYKYESKVIEKIQIVNSEEEKERVLKANKDAKVATKEEVAEYKTLDLDVEQHKNVYMDSKENLYTLSGEKELRFTKNLKAMDKADQDNQDGFWTSLFKNYGPETAATTVLSVVGLAAAGVAIAATAPVSVPAAAVTTGVLATAKAGLASLGAIKAAALVTGTVAASAAASGLVVDEAKEFLDEREQGILNSQLNSQLNEIYKVVEEGRSKIDINNIFDDPYVNSLSKVLSQKYTTNGEYMFSKELRDSIVELEKTKIKYSEMLSTLVETHKLLKDDPNKVDEFNKNQEDFKKTLASYNEFKSSKIQHIENEIEKLKANQDPSSEIHKHLMDAKTFNSLREIKYVNDVVGNLDKNENLKLLDDIEKIRLDLTVLDLAVDQGLLFNKNTNIKDYDSNNYSSKKEIEKLKDILNKLADSQENQGMSLTDKFANLSNEERNSFLTRYSKVSNGINEHINKQIDNIKPEHQYLVSNLKGKDFINVSEIAKISQKLVDREAIELAEKESKEKLEIETSKAPIPNAFDNNI